LVINKELVASLRKRGLWDSKMRSDIIAHKGSIQGIDRISDNLKEVFRTTWEIKQSSILRMAAERGPFIDQNQSLNLHIASPTRAMLISLILLAWRLGLKSANYYVRRKAEVSATAFNTVSASVGETSRSDTDKEHEDAEVIRACKLDAAMRGDDCEACGS